MKLVMTLVVRDESDLVDTQIAYHLNAGVDLVIAAIGEASQETAELLAPYERDGSVRLLTELGEGGAADMSRPSTGGRAARVSRMCSPRFRRATRSSRGSGGCFLLNAARTRSSASG